jgi:hypothetical protein
VRSILRSPGLSSTILFAKRGQRHVGPPGLFRCHDDAGRVDGHVRGYGNLVADLLVRLVVAQTSGEVLWSDLRTQKNRPEAVSLYCADDREGQSAR